MDKASRARSVGSEPSVNMADSGTLLSLALCTLTLRSADQKSLILYHKAEPTNRRPEKKLGPIQGRSVTHGRVAAVARY